MIFEMFGLDLWLSGLSSTCLIQIFGVFLEVKISILICKKENNQRAP